MPRLATSSWGLGIGVRGFGFVRLSSAHEACGDIVGKFELSVGWLWSYCRQAARVLAGVWGNRVFIRYLAPFLPRIFTPILHTSTTQFLEVKFFITQNPQDQLLLKPSFNKLTGSGFGFVETEINCK